MREGMATLSEIAKKCGVSTATVSYVMSGKGEEKRISPAMQELIQSAAGELGYTRVSGAASSVQPRIAVFWPQLAARRISSSTEIVLHPTMIYRASSPAPTFAERQAMEARRLAVGAL